MPAVPAVPAVPAEKEMYAFTVEYEGGLMDYRNISWKPTLPITVRHTTIARPSYIAGNVLRTQSWR